MIYHCWAVQFVPDPARGEHTNIGLVIGGENLDWAVRYDPRFVRSHGDLSSDLRELAAWGRSFVRVVDGHTSPFLDEPAGVSPGLVEHMRRRQSNLVQFGEPTPVDAESAEAAVHLLYPVLVERPRSRRRTTYSRRTLRSRVREVMTKTDGFVTGRDLFVTPRLSIGRQHGELDLLRIERGQPVLTNVWAFNVIDLSALTRDLQSWSYLVGLLRTDGATAEVTGAGVRVIPASVGVEVVFDPPRDQDSQHSERWDIYEAAREAWQRNDVSVRSIDEYRSQTTDERQGVRP